MTSLGTMFYADVKKRPPPAEYDAVLASSALALLAIGLVMVYSASSAYAMTHAEYNYDSLYFIKSGIAYTVAGLGLMGAMILVPARWLRRAAPRAWTAAA